MSVFSDACSYSPSCFVLRVLRFIYPRDGFHIIWSFFSNDRLICFSLARLRRPEWEHPGAKAIQSECPLFITYECSLTVLVDLILPIGVGSKLPADSLQSHF